MSTYSSPIVRATWFRDSANHLTDYKRTDEILVFTAAAPLWDLTDWLRTGETISSVVWDESGLTISGTGNSNTAVYATITGTGSVVIEVTTSAGREKHERFQWLSKNDEQTDYP